MPSSDVRLEPSDVLEGGRAFRQVLSAILGWDEETATLTRQFTNGLSNHVFLVSRLDGRAEVIVRIFGSVDQSAVDSVRVFELLSAAGIAPTSLGLFANGRLEQYLADYVPIDSLTVMEQYAGGVARELARFHDQATRALCAGGASVESLGTRVRRWRAEVEALGLDLEWVRDELLQLDVDGMLSSICGFEEAVLHGDLQAGNIMVGEGGAVRFIDFDYICRGPVSFDLANHFVEWSWSGDYSVLDFREERWPSLAQRRAFVSAYLSTTDAGRVDRLLAEVDVCVRVSHLHWALWGVLEGARRQGTATFDYEMYAKGRARLLASNFDFRKT